MISSRIEFKEFAERQANIFQKAAPFPHIVIDDFFDEVFLGQVLDEFPDLAGSKENKIKNSRQRKFASQGTALFGEKTKQLFDFLNREEFLNQLQVLTGIKETLIADFDYLGGGLHEIKRRGLLKIHTDFSKHRTNGLDRRLNLLVFLNKSWKEEYGGDLELWNREMKEAVVKISPDFNRLVIFETTSTSYHGHPDPLQCPEDRSRKSLAIYYYSDGRPYDPLNPENAKIPTTFYARPNNADDARTVPHLTVRERMLREVKSLFGK